MDKDKSSIIDILREFHKSNTEISKFDLFKKFCEVWRLGYKTKEAESRFKISFDHLVYMQMVEVSGSNYATITKSYLEYIRDNYPVPNVNPKMDRYEVISAIEGIVGSLKSITWSKVSNNDLATLFNALREK